MNQKHQKRKEPTSSPPEPAIQTEFGKALIHGVLNDKVEDVFIELLDKEVLKEVPFLKFIFAVRKTWTSIGDRLFLQKVEGFIRATPKFSQAERESFAREHLSDAKKAQKLGDAIVLILHRLDDLGKPKMLAMAFAAFVRGRIDLETFRRLATAIDIAFISDLQTLAEEACPYMNSSLCSNLLRTGLVEINPAMDTTVPAQAPPEMRHAYKLNDLGKALIQCLSLTATSTGTIVAKSNHTI
jgi:hypothetical protein